jgi:plasmid stabilization system protein ParE
VKTYRVRLSDQATADLGRIFEDILPAACEHIARDFVGRLYEACLKLDTFPERGTRRDEVRLGLRIIGYRRQASIAFVVGETDVYILRVFRRGEDVEARLAETSDFDEPESWPTEP